MNEEKASSSDSERTFRLLVEAVQDYAIYMLDPSGRVSTWNTGAHRIKGYSSNEIIGRHFECFFTPENRADGVPQQLLREAAASGRHVGEGWRVRKDGSRFWASIVLSAIYDEDGRIRGFTKVTRDLTERKLKDESLKASEAALHAERDRLQVTLFSIADGVICTDQNAKITLMNPAAEFMTGWKLEDARGRNIDEVFRLVDSTRGTEMRNPIHNCFVRNDIYLLREGATLIAADGGERVIHDSASPIRDASGRTIGAVLVFHDVTGLREAQRELEFHATHDALTLLPNRRAFEMWLSDLWQQIRITEIDSAVCFIDLDGFKVINDTAGHDAGDLFLRTIADLLRSRVRGLDLVARLGGDEFVVVLAGCTPNDANETLQQILSAIAEYLFFWDGRVFQLTASIGVASLRPDSTIDEVMKEADVACYAAKRSGRNQICVYGTSLDEAHEQHFELFLAADLRAALHENRFLLYAQKIQGVRNKQVQRYEVLLRMNDGEGELISPHSFIPAAERHN